MRVQAVDDPGESMKLRAVLLVAVASMMAVMPTDDLLAQDKKKSKQKKTRESSFSLKGFEKVRFKQTPQGELHLHVLKPEGWKAADQRPGIVFFFGGGWNGGSPGQFEQHCRYLASRGMVAITAEYRVKSRHSTSPFECVKDGKSAVRWIRAHADVLGIDPERLAAGGGSAGGHVAASTGTTKTIVEDGEDLSVSHVPNAMALFNPVYNNGPGQYGHDRVKNKWREISPAHNIRRGVPPAIVFFGSRDKLVTVETAEAFQSAMKKVGSDSELHVTEGAGHGWFNYGKDGNKAFIDTVTKMDRFFAKLGWIEGKPKVREFLAAR